MDAAERPEQGPSPVLGTARTALRPVAPDDGPTLRAILATPAVARWWHPPGEDFPYDDDPDTVRWVVELGTAPDVGPTGAVVGMVQAYEGDDPDYDECGIDVFLAASVHRRGLGREVVTVVRDWLLARGHHLVTIDPAADNHGAIACYKSCGFVPVGLLPRRERDTHGDGWHDTLLMAYAVPPT